MRVVQEPLNVDNKAAVREHEGTDTLAGMEKFVYIPVYHDE